LDSWPISPPTMDTPINLSFLDPSIVERIVREAEESLVETRLISPSWNTAVRDYLKTTKLGAIERVYLSGLPDDNNGQQLTMGMRGAVGENVQMVAILPEKHE
ncbi:hypothetical protein PMAYCL1PPCAC_03252, partial [Pristionchus mayeri]